MKSVFTVGPTAEPIALAVAKAHARVDYDDEDELIRGWLRAAREKLEDETSRSLVCQTRRFDLDEFPTSGLIEIRWAPVIAVSSIQYYDADNVLQTLSASAYQVDADSIPARICLAPTYSWPTTYQRPRAVRVSVVCGHATPFTVDATTDVLTWLGRNPTDDDVVRLTNTGGALPAGLSADTDYYVISSSGATCELSLTSGGAAVDITGAGTGTHFVGEVPAVAKQAMLLLAGHWINNREAVLTGTISKEFEFAYTALTEHLMWSRYV